MGEAIGQGFGMTMDESEMRPSDVLVTGAAGAIGSATVRAFLNAGFKVLGMDRTPDVESLVVDPSYRGVRVDLTDSAAVDTALAGVEPRRLTHVIGIAGGALAGEPQSQHDPLLLSFDTFRESVDANLTTQFLMLRAVLPYLRTNAGADRTVTFTSSWNALTGCGMPAYSAAKAGLIGMMHALVTPLGAEGIRVNVVAPGTVRTPRTERIWGHVSGHFERLESSTASGRLTSSDDVAGTYLALATLMTNVTGQVIVVDGGQMVRRS